MPDSPSTPKQAADGVYRFGRFVLDAANRQLIDNGAPVALRARPFDLLRVLLEHGGRLVSKDRLLDLAWPGVVVEENNLQVQVSVLRKILGPEAIATLPGRGYRLVMPITSVALVAAMEQTPVAIATSAEFATPLIGRDDDVAAAIDCLRQFRLLTVVGAGGIGKTRLAQAIARQMAGEFADGVLWVELSPLSDPTFDVALLANRISDKLCTPLAAGGAPLDLLVAALRGRALLLVLDSAEHLLAAVAPVVAAIVAGTERVRVLVTSQAHLKLGAEQIYRLAALALPPPGTPCDELLRYGAIELFVRRAQAADRRFAFDAGNADEVIEICRRLDGIALALELAAARVPLLGVSALAARLDQRFRLLTAGSRDAPTRQQTLLATLDWSHQLLGADEQVAFRRLGLTAGPVTLEQACVIVADERLDEWAALDLIGALVDRSLVTIDSGEVPRYGMLETARAYAREKLRAAGETAAIERAVRVYESEGDHAAAASASAAALANYSTALDLTALLSAGTARNERRLDLNLKLGPAIQTALGPFHPRCEQVYREATDLARAVPADGRAFKALWGVWQCLCTAGRDREAATYAKQIVRLAPQLNDDGFELEAYHAMMTTQQLLGNAPAVVENAQRAIALYDQTRHHALTFAFGGHDPGVCALGQGSIGLWLTGRVDQAIAMAARAIALGESMAHGYSRGTAYYNAAITFEACGMTRELARVADALVALSDQAGMAMLLTQGEFFRGRARYEQGECARGIAEMQRALATIDAAHDSYFALGYVTLLADALLAQGRNDEALKWIERGFAYAAGGQEFFLPEMFRLRGELHAAAGELDAAAHALQRACERADAQAAPSLALRAATARARLALSPAPGRAALDDLRTRLARFREGAQTRDQQAARELL